MKIELYKASERKPDEFGEYIVLVAGSDKFTTLRYNRLTDTWYEYGIGEDFEIYNYNVDYWAPFPDRKTIEMETI